MSDEKAMVYAMGNGDEMKLTMGMVKKYLVTGKSDLVTEQELVYFMHECKARRLNPFLRQCWLIKYSEREQAQIVESIHHKRAKAMEHPTCEGWEKGLIILDKDGVLKRSTGLLLKGETLIGAWFKATPKGWKVPYEVEVNLDGYIKKTKDGSITAFWSKEKQPSQIMKVVESQGLSALWGNATAPSYIEEELPSNDSVEMINNNGVYHAEKQIIDTSKYDNLIKTKQVDLALLGKFEEVTAKANNSTVEELKVVAAENLDRFLASFETWKLKNEPEKKADVSTLPQETIDKINQAFELDHQAAKAAMIECGTDSVERMSEAQASNFLREFNMMLDKGVDTIK